ncbi:hypothetical protein BST61_g7640 [Cercospora zeina]
MKKLTRNFSASPLQCAASQKHTNLDDIGEACRIQKRDENVAEFCMGGCSHAHKCEMPATATILQPPLQPQSKQHQTSYSVYCTWSPMADLGAWDTSAFWEQENSELGAIPSGFEIAHEDEDLVENAATPERSRLFTEQLNCWGDDNFIRPITLSGHPKMITITLDTILRHLRDPSKEITLWADQLCINQQNFAGYRLGVSGLGIRDDEEEEETKDEKKEKIQSGFEVAAGICSAKTYFSTSFGSESMLSWLVDTSKPKENLYRSQLVTRI